MFRRFQVTFTSPSDASVLIQSIQGQCICTPARGNENQKPESMPPPSVVPTAARTPLVPSTTTGERMTRGESMIQSYERPLDNTMSHSHISPSIQQTPSSAVFGTDSGPVLASTRPSQSYHNISLAKSIYPWESQMPLPSTAQSQVSQLPAQTSNRSLDPIPHSPEPSLDVSGLRPAAWSDPRAPSSTPPTAPSSDPIGPTVVSVANLYQLPAEELESAIGDILREPGFEEFVSNLSKPSRDT